MSEVREVERRARVRVEKRPDYHLILSEINKGTSLNSISQKYKVAYDSLVRIKKKQLPSKARETVLDYLDYLKIETDKMMFAAKAVICDPTDPSKYNFNPSADEIEVIVYDPETRKREKVTLSNCLGRIEESGKYEVVRCFYAKEDPRKILLKCIEVMRGNLELIAKLQGELKDVQVNVDVTSAVVPVIIDVVKDKLRDHPELMLDIVKGIEEGISRE